MKKAYTDNEILNCISNGGKPLNDCMYYLYHYSGMKEKVINFVLANGGNRQDGEDIFQDSISNMILNIRNGRFKSNSSILTYLLAICKNLWFNKYNREIKLNEIKQKLIDKQVKNMNSPEEMLFKNYNSLLMNKLLKKIGNTCKKVLGLWALNYSFKEIGKKIGKSEGATRKHKFECMKRLITLFKNNPEIIKEFQ